jgi:hypothetical protein
MGIQRSPPSWRRWHLQLFRSSFGFSAADVQNSSDMEPSCKPCTPMDSQFPHLMWMDRTDQSSAPVSGFPILLGQWSLTRR